MGLDQFQKPGPCFSCPTGEWSRQTQAVFNKRRMAGGFGPLTALFNQLSHDRFVRCAAFEINHR
jgi:hypothetical protein